MPKVSDEQAEEDGLPDPHVGGGSQNESLVESEEEVEIGELGHGDRGPEWDGRRGRSRIGEPEVFILVEVGEICSDEDRDRFNYKEEDAVDEWQREWDARGCRGV